MLRADLSITGTVRHSGDEDFGAVSRLLRLSQVYQFTEGTGDNQAQAPLTDTRTLAGSANEDLDLLALLPDVIAPAVTPTKLRLLALLADEANGNNIVFKPAASNGFVGPFGGTLPTFTLKPGGMFMFIEPLGAGWPLDGTHKSINVANSDIVAAIYSIWALAA
jgi:hypothetical protein